MFYSKKSLENAIKTLLPDQDVDYLAYDGLKLVELVAIKYFLSSGEHGDKEVYNSYEICRSALRDHIAYNQFIFRKV